MGQTATMAMTNAAALLLQGGVIVGDAGKNDHKVTGNTENVTAMDDVHHDSIFVCEYCEECFLSEEAVVDHVCMARSLPPRRTPSISNKS